MGKHLGGLAAEKQRGHTAASVDVVGRPVLEHPVPSGSAPSDLTVGDEESSTPYGVAPSYAHRRSRANLPVVVVRVAGSSPVVRSTVVRSA